MKRVIVRLFSIVAIVLVAGLVPSELRADEKDGVKIYVAESGFEDAVFELENAIVDRGLKIDYRGHIGAMMDRTASDFGDEKGAYQDAQFFTFCSVPLTRDMVKADPRNVGLCPYIVFLYELRSDPGKTHVGYRRPITNGSQASIAAVGAVENLLDEIIKQVTE
jgi:hypothetical protein